MASLERMRNNSLEKITIDLPQIVNMNSHGPVTLEHKNMLPKSKAGDGSSFDFLDATTGASQGRNQVNKIFTTEKSNSRDIRVGDSTNFSNSIVSAKDIQKQSYELAKKISKLGKHQKSRAMISDSVGTGSASIVVRDDKSQKMLINDPSRQYLEVTFMQDGTQMTPIQKRKMAESTQDVTSINSKMNQSSPLQPRDLQS